MKQTLWLALILQLAVFSTDNSFAVSSVEKSSGLQSALTTHFFDNGGLSLEKIGQFKAKISQLKKEETRNIHLLDKNKSLEEIEKEGKLVGIKFINENLRLLLVEKDFSKQQKIAKKVLKIYFGLMRYSRPAELIQVGTMISETVFKMPRVPLKDEKRELSSNLLNVKENRYFEKVELKALISRGLDISKLDPADSPYWKRPKDIANKDPRSSAEVFGKRKEFYFSKVKTTNTNPKINVFYKNQSGRKITVKIKFGKEINSAYVASRIAELIGFYADPSYYMDNIKIYFENEDAYKKMIKDWIGYFNVSDAYLPFKYVKKTGVDEKGFYAIFKEGIVQPKNKKMIKVGPMPSSKIGNWQRRELRGQLLFEAFINNADYKMAENSKTVLIENKKKPISDWEIVEANHDLGYSFGGLFFNNAPNYYKWSFIKKGLLNVKFTDFKRFHYLPRKKSPFHQVSYSDLKWMAHYMVQITQRQFKTIIKNSGWPKVVGDLYFQKFVKRRNEIVRVFNLENEVIKGRRISLWDEVRPRRYNVGKVVRRGKLTKHFKNDNYTVVYNPSFFNDQGHILKIQEILVENLSSILGEIPFYKMFSFEGNRRFFDFKGIIPGVGLGFNFKRSIDLNVENPSAKETWKVSDTLTLFGTVGAGGFMPINSHIKFVMDGSLKVGTEVTRTYHVDNLLTAIRGNIKDVIKMPFKKASYIKKLAPKESFSYGKFIWVKVSEGIETGLVGLTSLGAEVSQGFKYFINKTNITKKNDSTYRVDKIKSKEFILGMAFYFKFFEVIQLNFFSAEAKIGKIEEKTYFFDQSSVYAKDLNFDILAYTDSLKKLPKDLKPAQSQVKNYVDANWSLGFISKIGRDSKGVQEVTINEKGEIARRYIYTTAIKTSYVPISKVVSYKVETILDFKDDFKTIEDKKISLIYEYKNKQASKKSLKKYIDKVNKWSNTEDFLTYSPDLYAPGHLGAVYGKTVINFNDRATNCLFENTTCERNKVRFDGLMNFNLKVIQSLKPIRKAKRLSKWISRYMFLKGKRLHSLLTYIGYDNVSVLPVIRGNYLNEKGIITDEKRFASGF